MKKVLTFIIVILLFNSCMKEEKTWEYWDNLADKKLEEILNLSKSYNCAQTSNLTIQEIYTNCPISILIHKDDLKKFDNMNAQLKHYWEEAKN